MSAVNEEKNPLTEIFDMFRDTDKNLGEMIALLDGKIRLVGERQAELEKQFSRLLDTLIKAKETK